MAKASMDFSGFDALVKAVDAMGGDIEEAAKAAMVKTHEHVTAKIEQAMSVQKINGKPVNWEHTGETKETLRKEAEVLVSGGVASVKTGFEWPTAARYLAYGRGTPRAMKASPDLKNSLDYKKLREEVLAIQEQALEEFIAAKMGGG